MIFKCSQCEYITDLKTNLTRHSMRKHKSDEKYGIKKLLKTLIIDIKIVISKINTKTKTDSNLQKCKNLLNIFFYFIQS